jgi:hypothetical protein
LSLEGGYGRDPAHPIRLGHLGGLLRNPELTKEPDLPVEAQQLARGLNSADSALSLRHGVPVREDIIPKLLRNPDLTRRLDLTGEPQQLSRGLNAADSAASLRHGVPAREDIQSLRSTIAQQGLRGLLERVEKHGYSGLPAAGLYALPDREEK